MDRGEFEEHLAMLLMGSGITYHKMKSEDAIRAEYLRLTAVERAAVAESEEVQRDWLSPVEAHALRAEVARLRAALKDIAHGPVGYWNLPEHREEVISHMMKVASAALEVKPCLR